LKSLVFIDNPDNEWDNPTMSTAKVDSKKRIVLPDGRPGDIYDVQTEGEKRIVLVRLEKPEPAKRMSREACMEAISEAPLNPTTPWEKLRELTREP